MYLWHTRCKRDKLNETGYCHRYRLQIKEGMGCPYKNTRKVQVLPYTRHGAGAEVRTHDLVVMAISLGGRRQSPLASCSFLRVGFWRGNKQ
jgi:hypothetical protein